MIDCWTCTEQYFSLYIQVEKRTSNKTLAIEYRSNKLKGISKDHNPETRRKCENKKIRTCWAITTRRQSGRGIINTFWGIGWVIGLKILTVLEEAGIMDMNKFSLVTSLSGITMKFFFGTWHLGFNHPQLTHILALNMFISHCWFLHSE